MDGVLWREARQVSVSVSSGVAVVVGVRTAGVLGSNSELKRVMSPEISAFQQGGEVYAWLHRVTQLEGRAQRWKAR